MATKWLDRTLIRLPMCLALFTDAADFEREISKADYNLPPERRPQFPVWPTNARVSFIEAPGVTRVALVCVRNVSKYGRAQVYATLTHEAVHIWQEARKYIGEESPSCEFEAYAVESIALELFDAYDAQVKAKRKKRRAR